MSLYIYILATPVDVKSTKPLKKIMDLMRFAYPQSPSGLN